MRLLSENRRTLPPVQAVPPTRTVAAPRRIRRWVVWLIVFSCAVAGFGIASPVRAQVINREYKLKAAFLYKFTTYIRWPDGSFKDSKSPFVIAVLGPDPVGADLRKIAAVKQIDGRELEIHNF